MASTQSLAAASSAGDVEAVREHLRNLTGDVNARDEHGRTALHKAVSMGHADVVELLLHAGGEVEAADEWGRTPMQYAISNRAIDGTTRKFSASIMAELQALVRFGASWDALCDGMIHIGEALYEAPALRLCVLLWEREHSKKTTFTQIPQEMVRRGTEITGRYIGELQQSSRHRIVARIGVVGSSGSGKSSFIKSITTKTPCLEHPNDRTVGIDEYVLRFGDQSKSYEVKMCDFAGHDVYHSVHSLFFTRRTIYFVCVDLYSYSVALKKARLLADYDSQADRFMDEFLDMKILKWIRLIVARQPDAEFVFVATKIDMAEKSKRFARSAQSDLEMRLQKYVADTTKELQQALDEERQSRGASNMQFVKTETLRFLQLQTLLGTVQRLLQHEWVRVGCVDPKSIEAAREKIEKLVKTSSRCFAMPGSYSTALDFICRTRDRSSSKGDASLRASETLLNIDDVVISLHGNNSGVDSDTHREILRTLHDFGDVLWYEDLGIERLQHEIILDPMLLIDFIRPIADYNFQSEVMAHSTLKSLPPWLYLDHHLMLTMKSLLQEFNLVHVAGQHEMQWDSDLIIPASWKPKSPASLRFGDQPLEFEFEEMTRKSRPLNSSADEPEITVKVRWEYHFMDHLPESVFDQVVIASQSWLFNRTAGPDWILYQKNGAFACRIVISRHSVTKQRSVRLEAIAAGSTEQQAELWGLFEHLCSTLESVLISFRGLAVSRYVFNDTGERHALETVVDAWIVWELSQRRIVSWMPPTLDWYHRFRIDTALASSKDYTVAPHHVEQPREERLRVIDESIPSVNQVTDKALAMTRESQSLVSDLMCGHPDRRCSEPRDVKTNGKPHRYCRMHRLRYNQYQRAYLRRRRVAAVQHEHAVHHDEALNALTTKMFLIEDDNAVPDHEAIDSLITEMFPIDNDNEVPDHEAINSLMTEMFLIDDHEVNSPFSLPRVVSHPQENSTVHKACESGDLSLLRRLIDSRESITSLDADGNTPLHKACQYSISEVCRFLLRRGALASSKNKADQTPLCLLLSNWQQSLSPNERDDEVLECIHLLLAHGAEWDDVCEDAVRRHNDGGVARNVAASVRVWSQSSGTSDRQSLLKLPASIFRRGSQAITDLIAKVRGSEPSADHFRQRICVLSPDENLSREFVAALLEPDQTLNSSSRIHFTRYSELNTAKTYDVSVWNVPAGGDLDAVNSIFFANRILYVVCVGRGAPSEPDPERELHADCSPSYIEDVARLVKLVHARYPDAAIVLAEVTHEDKADSMPGSLLDVELVKAELNVASNQFVASVDREIERFTSAQCQIPSGITFGNMHVNNATRNLTKDEEEAIERARLTFANFKKKFASLVPKCVTIRVGQRNQQCSETTSTNSENNRNRILRELITSGLPTTDTLEEVIQAIRRLRQEASQHAGGRRMRESIFSQNTLFERVKVEICGLDRHDFDAKIEVCLELGEVVQCNYRPSSDGSLANEVKLAIDPEFFMLLLETAFREATGRDQLSRTTLCSLPVWSEFDEESLLLATQTFEDMRLVYRVPSLTNTDWSLEFSTHSVSSPRCPTQEGELAQETAEQKTGLCILAREYQFVIKPPAILVGHVMAATWKLRNLSLRANTTPDSTSCSCSEEPTVHGQGSIKISDTSRDGEYVLRLEIHASDPPKNSQRNHFLAVHSTIQQVFDQYPGLLITWTTCGWLPAGWAYDEDKIVDDRRRRRVVVVDDSLRCSNVCVIGPRHWGRTSLIKSLTTNSPSLGKSQPSALGVEVTSGYFVEREPDSVIGKRHIVNFSKFSGETKYEQIHTLFYQHSMIFLVCVDLVAYAAAQAQAKLLEDNDSDEGFRLDAFVARNVIRRVESVLDHQRKARFAFVATKADRITKARANGVRRDFAVRLQVHVRLQTKSISARQERSKSQNGASDRARQAMANLLASSQRLGAEISAIGSNESTMWICVSCAADDLVAKAQKKVEALVVETDQSVVLPRLYSRVYQALKDEKQQLRSLSAVKRVTSTVISVGQLRDKLRASQLSMSEFNTAVLLLDSLGDVIHLSNLLQGTPLDDGPMDYDDQSAKVLLDMQLVVQLVRNLFDQNPEHEKLTHKQLSRAPFWSSIDDHQLLFAMKCVLEKFRLALPHNSPMTLDSQLFVPAFWKQAIGNHDINVTPPVFRSTSPAPAPYRASWRYDVGWTLPDTFFERLAVASYSTRWPRVVYRGLIKFKDRTQENDHFPCQVWIERDRPEPDNTKGQYVVVIEAASTSRESRNIAWAAFRHVVKAMKILKDDPYPGLYDTPYTIAGSGVEEPIEEILREGWDEDMMPPDLHDYRAILGP